MPRHLTVRLAWHDSGWNGRICANPLANTDCIGTRSLLSDRLRRDRDAGLEDEVRTEPLGVKLPQYMPPCYWGINAFGSEAHEVVHRHAFADLRDTHAISDTLPAFSVVTWPFRIAFNFDEETKKRYGKYHPKLGDRINDFFRAHQEGKSIVFLYLNYDNPVSGDEPRYAVVGCGLLKEKGKATRFEFSDAELSKYRSGRDMQNFPVVNWARRLTLDPDTIVRLPYQEYVQHVRDNSDDEDKLDEIRVLVTDEALVPSFKYVCDSMDDDQCLYLLHQLRRAVERVGAHGIVPDYEEKATARIDRLIAGVWKRRGAYPGLPGALAYLAKVGSQSDEANEERAQQVVDALQAELTPAQDLADEVEKLLTNSEKLASAFTPFRRLLDTMRSAVAEDPESLPSLLQLSQFSLTAFQMERILSAQPSNDEPATFRHRSVSTPTVLENPYELAESYVPVTNDREQRWKELERPLRRDGPIGVFHIDAGLFPDEDYVTPGARYKLAASGPERTRALVLQHLSEQARRHSDSFSPLDDVHEALSENPLFYRRKLTLRPEILKSGRFLDHFQTRIAHVEHAGRSYFYLREVLDAEKLVERTIQELLKRPERSADTSWMPEWIETQIKELAATMPRDFDATAFRGERSRAIASLLRRSFLILTGRPGSGKTHVIGKVVRTLLDAKQSVVVLAPTGKAVLRLQAAAGIAAKTIDKLLHEAWLTEDSVAGPEEISSEHLRRIGDIRNLVIDESSMLDLPKLATLFRILHKQGLQKVDRVILVGDVNQLPPIGLGRPFEDIISWLDRDPKRREHHVHLETNCRHLSNGRVLEVAELFISRNRYYDELLNEVQDGRSQGDGLHVVLWKNTDELSQALDRELAGLIRREVSKSVVEKSIGLNILLGLDEDGSVPKDHSKRLQLERFQILTPYHGRFKHAARALNEVVHDRYRKSAPKIGGFRQGDKVIRLSNKYNGSELLVSNGTIGVISGRGRTPKPHMIFNSRPTPLAIGGDEHEQYELAYAITVHKAQGSEFDHVFVVLPSHWPLLTRELVYTALTRSKAGVTLFIEDSGKRPLEIARRRSSVLARNSSVFEHPLDKHSLLQPEPGEFVDSKVEYILYTALMQARELGRLRFAHHQTMELQLSSGVRLVKPDFLIETPSGNKWILEHLGMLDGERYSAKWREKRAAYREAGWEQRLITTDDLNGLLSSTLEKVIEHISADTPVNTPKSPFSPHHYRLGET